MNRAGTGNVELSFLPAGESIGRDGSAAVTP